MKISAFIFRFLWVILYSSAFFFWSNTVVHFKLSLFRILQNWDWPVIIKWDQSGPIPVQGGSPTRTYWKPMGPQPKGARQNVVPRHDRCPCHNCWVLATAIICTRVHTNMWGTEKSSFGMIVVRLDTLTLGGPWPWV